ncbi:Uma2 family endonuclease [Actinoallomurus acanthiterrae]
MNTESRRRIRDALAHWPSPPPWGWTADDMDRLPSDGPNGEPGFFERLELIDGALIFAAPQSRFHERTLHALVTELSSQAPDDVCAVWRMDVKLGHRMRPCPDVLVIDSAAADDLDRTFYTPDEVHLAVEVVSPESEERDRKLKPPRYAEAGIVHFWRVEENDGRPVVYVYELDPATKTYALTGIHHGTLSVLVPFPISVDLENLPR